MAGALGTSGVAGRVGITPPSDRAATSAKVAHRIGAGTCSHRLETPTVSTTSWASTRGAPTHAVSRRAHSGRGKCAASTSGVA